jgi:hypothetical protein
MAKLNSIKKQKKYPFYEENNLVGLTPGETNSITLQSLDRRKLQKQDSLINLSDLEDE